MPSTQGAAAAKRTSAKHKQAQARYTATKARLASSKKKHQVKRAAKLKKPKAPPSAPLPKLQPLPVKLQNYSAVLLQYQVQAWQVGIARFTTQACTIKAYVLSVNAAAGTAVCYVPSKHQHTSSAPSAQVVAALNSSAFNAGIQHYTIIQWLT